MNEFIDVTQQLIALLPEPLIVVGLLAASFLGLLLPFSIATAAGHLVSTEVMVVVLVVLAVVVIALAVYDYFTTKRVRAGRHAAPL